MKRLFAFTLVAVSAMLAHGQTEERLRIVYADGDRTEIAVDILSHIDFVTRPSIYDACPVGTVAEPVDLGLSVLWASWNVGAEKASDFGGYFGWADPTGNVTSTSSSDYHTEVTDIAGTQWDGATAKWGQQWRIPTKAQWQELIDGCSWQLSELNGESGWRVTGQNGNSIFLPMTGYRYGTAFPSAFNLTEYRLADAYGSYFSAGFSSNRIKISEYGLAYEGMPIRAVCDAAPEPYLTIAPAQAWLSAAASATATLEVDANCAWRLVSGKPSWLTVSPDRGNTPATITLTATANTYSSERTATLHFGSEGAGTVDVIVTQAGRQAPVTLFEVPYLGWGATEAVTRQNMSSYSLLREGTNDSGSRYLYYNGKHQETGTLMFFADGYGLWAARTAIKKSVTTLDEIDQILTEKFIYVKTANDGTRIYATLDYSSESIDTQVNLYGSDDGFYYIDYYSYKYINPDPTPTPDLFEAPYLSWGTSRAAVRSYMSSHGYTQIDESLSASSGYYLVYGGKKLEEFSAYYFNASQALMQVNVCLLTATASRNDVGTFLTQKLNYISMGATSDGTADMYLSSDYATVVYVEIVSASGVDVTNVAFYDLDALGSSVKASRQNAPDKRTMKAIMEQAPPQPRPLPQKLIQRIVISKAFGGTDNETLRGKLSLEDAPRP